MERKNWVIGLVVWLSVIGYPTLRVPAVIGEEEMSPLGNLGTIVVTATRLPEKLSDLPTNVSVITKEDIARTDARNLGEAIRNSVDIDVSKKGTIGSETSVSLRGSSSQQVLVMIDGRSVNSLSLGTANLTEIPIDNIEKIEIVRGPVSALYGANALGGVVNVITRQAGEGKPITELYASYGDFNTQLYRANFGVKKEKFDTFLTANKKLSNGWRENSDYDSDNFMIRTGYDTEKIGKFIFNAGYYEDNLGSPGAKYAGMELTDASSPDARQDDEKIYTNLEYQNGFKDLIDLKIKLYGNNDKQNYSNSGIGWAVKDFRRSITKGVEMQLNTVYDAIMGIDIHQDEFRQEDKIVREDKINKKILNQAIFAEKQFSFKLLKAILGLRYDHHSTYGGQLNPQFSVIYWPTKSVRFSSNIGRAFRAPTFNDLYWPCEKETFWGTTYITTGNSELKPERGWSYDLGIEYRLKNIFLGKLTLFRSDVKNLIRWRSVEISPGIYKLSPLTDQAYSQGVEWELFNKVRKGLTQSLNGCFLEAKVKKGEGSWESQKFKPSWRLNYKINYESNFGLGANLNIEYVDKCWERDGRLGYKIPAYTILNLRVSQEILGAEIFLGVNNVADKQYITRTDEYGSPYPLPGRTISGGIKMKFWD